MTTWILNDDGTLTDPQGRIRTHLSNAEQDAVIKCFSIPVPPLETTKQNYKSYTGIRISDNIADTRIQTHTETEDCDPMYLKMYEKGGIRLATLYCTDYNVRLAAKELGIKYCTLAKWFLRFRARIVRDGITPADWGLLV